MPPCVLGTGPVPAAFNPMRFPWMTFPCGEPTFALLNSMPTALPEMTFCASGTKPPIKLFEPEIWIPELIVKARDGSTASHVSADIVALHGNALAGTVETQFDV